MLYFLYIQDVTRRVSFFEKPSISDFVGGLHACCSSTIELPVFILGALITNLLAKEVLLLVLDKKKCKAHYCSFNMIAAAAYIKNASF